MAIPGLVIERCQCLIKGLPKTLRKGFVPVNKAVKELLNGVSYEDGPLFKVLINAAKSQRNISLSYEDLDMVSVPSHLVVKIRVLDKNSNEVAF